MSENILSTKEIQTRLIDVEYMNLNSDQLENKLRQIYLEETRGNLIRISLK